MNSLRQVIQYYTATQISEQLIIFNSVSTDPVYFESTFVDPDSALSFFSYAQIFLEMVPLLMSNNFYVEIQGFENIFTFKKSDTA